MQRPDVVHRLESVQIIIVNRGHLEALHSASNDVEIGALAQVLLERSGLEVEHPAAVLQLEPRWHLTGFPPFNLDIGIERLKPAVDLRNQLLTRRLEPRPPKIDFQEEVAVSQSPIKGVIELVDSGAIFWVDRIVAEDRCHLDAESRLPRHCA